MEGRSGQGEGGSGMEVEEVEGRTDGEVPGLSTSESSGEEEGETVSRLCLGESSQHLQGSDLGGRSFLNILSVLAGRSSLGASRYLSTVATTWTLDQLLFDDFYYVF